jgi:prolyl-tRNA synthetase
MILSIKKTAPWLAMSIAAISLTACFENSETASTTNSDPKAQAREELAKVQLTDSQTAIALKSFATQDSLVWKNSTTECQKAAIAVQAGLFDKQKALTLCADEWIDIVASQAIKNGDVANSGTCEADYKLLMQNMVTLENEYASKCRTTTPNTKDSLQMQTMIAKEVPYSTECSALATKIQSLKEKIGASCVNSGTGIDVVIPFDSNKVDYNLCSQLEYKLKTISASW